MQPEQSIASGNLLQDYLGLNRMADARTEMEQARKLGLDTSTLFRMVELQTYFLLGEPNEVQRMMTLVAGQPDEFLATQALAGTQLLSGEYQKAAATTQQSFRARGARQGSGRAGERPFNQCGRARICGFMRG